MPIELDALEQRIVGALIEKELTVPDAYPLTVNALVAACNQKSNRDPVMTAEDFDVEGALRSLMDRDWVTRREPVGGRALRYAHEVRSQLGIDEADLAILSELLCRGPQAPGALKTRASRMHVFASPTDIEARLRGLAERPVPYVRQLERRPRERAARWCHLLGKDVAADATPVAEALSPAAAVPAPPASPTPLYAASEAVPQATDLEERVQRLEEEVAELRDRLERLL